MSQTHPRLPKNYDAATIGSTPAHETLIEILNQLGNQDIHRNVIRTLNGYHTLLHRLASLSRADFADVTGLILEDRRVTILTSDYPSNVKTFLINCLVGKRRQMLDERRSFPTKGAS